MSTQRLLSTASLALYAACAVHGAANMPYNYEVHLLMDPAKVLGSDNKLLPTVLSTFAMPTSVTKLNVQFLDNSNKDIYSNGWSPRIRKTEGQNDFELTYKKRYPITNGDQTAALNTANNEGLDETTTTYDAQDEWGYSQQTVSISRQKSASGYSGLDLPSQTDSRSMLINNAPDKFDDWLYNGWGTGILSSARIYGPVLAKRSIGTWSSLQLYIEVWPIKAASGTGTDYIVEASFKVNGNSTAYQKHNDLQAFLQTKGWFLASDSLKTSLIMQRY